MDTTSSVSRLYESVSEVNENYLNFDSEVENIICEPIICFEHNSQNNSESEQVIENTICNNNQKRYYCKHSECDKSFAKLYGLQRHISSYIVRKSLLSVVSMNAIKPSEEEMLWNYISRDFTPERRSLYLNFITKTVTKSLDRNQVL